MMQEATELGVKFSVNIKDCINDTAKQIRQCHCRRRNVLMGTARKRRHKFSNVLKKPFCFRRRRSIIKLPTRFLLGGTINDPLNLRGLQKESDRQSDSHSFEVNSPLLTPKHSHRIGFPKIADASDPLNLKSISTEEQRSMSDDCIISMQKGKNVASQNHCQGLCALPFDKSEDISGPCLDFSTDSQETLPACDISTTLSEGNQPCVEVPDCSVNVHNCDDIQAKAAFEITDERAPLEIEAVVCTDSSKFTGHEKIVSPAVPQSTRHRGRKRRRQSAHGGTEPVSSASGSTKSFCRKKKEKFQCGNYVAYYGYRNIDVVKDPRLELLPKELFEGKDVLDIGCNAGIVTIAVASTCFPKMILGIDVDQRLIGLAKRNVRRYMDKDSYPSCLKNAFGPIAANLLPSAECSVFPHNILFQVGDYVPSSDTDLCRQCSEYDVILALSVTKWIHLTHGDSGLRRSFRRMFLQLRPGGKLILEAQPWSSYKRKKKLTDKIYEVYQGIHFKPEQFNDYLMSPEVGFSSCELLGTPVHKSKGFQRSIYLFTKPQATAGTSPT